jgi:hypothetical protein
MSMKMSHGMDAFPKTAIACRRGCIDMREAHFHIKRPCALGRGSHETDGKQYPLLENAQFSMGNTIEPPLNNLNAVCDVKQNE